jgi:DNA-directed RNA polymerase
MPADKYQRQVALEAESIQLGVTRYRREAPLPWRDKATGQREETERTPGKRLLVEALAPVIEGIEAWLANARSGKAGRKHSALPHVELCDPVQAAYIATRTAINQAALFKPVQQVLLAIAQGIEDHLNFQKLALQEHTREDGTVTTGGLAKRLEEQLKKVKHDGHRRKVLAGTLSYAAIERLKWTTRERLSLGQVLLEVIINATGIIEMTTLHLAANNTPMVVKPTPACEAWLKEAHARMELLSPVLLPMIVPPKPWKTPFSGGYLSGAVRNFRMIKTRNRQYLDEIASIDMPQVYGAVNAIQSVAWRINRPVLDVMKQVWTSGAEIGGLPSRVDRPLPVRPAEVPRDVELSDLPEYQKELMKAWKQKVARVHDENSRLGSKRIGMAQKLWMGERFAEETELYFPHQFDFRGRVYPCVPFVNPQADDSGKALLMFAEGHALGDNGAYWLAVHLANLFGVDKVSFDERVAWVMTNEDKILDSALRPLDGERFWTDADSPYCALAACFEWAGYRTTGDSYVSHVPVALDGSCSGLQHFAMLLRDRKSGEQVNLVPGSKPGDIYTAVAKVAQGKIDDMTDDAALPWHGGKVVRKVAKQPVMTLCYGATLRGMQDQVEKALKRLDDEGGEQYLEGFDNFLASRVAGKVIRESIGEVVSAAKQAMDWLQAAARVAAGAGLPVRWTTPVGLVVQQEYKQEVGKAYECFFGGRRVQLRVVEEGEKLDKKRQSSGISPNFVHSLDSAHMLATMNLCGANGVTSLACIHDSFGTHAGNIDKLHVAIRTAFVEQYRPNLLLRFRDELVAQLPEELAVELPPLPPLGDLDIEDVLGADYSFA